jgi:hypothetical protein
VLAPRPPVAAPPLTRVQPIGHGAPSFVVLSPATLGRHAVTVKRQARSRRPSHFSPRPSREADPADHRRASHRELSRSPVRPWRCRRWVVSAWPKPTNDTDADAGAHASERAPASHGLRRPGAHRNRRASLRGRGREDHRRGGVPQAPPVTRPPTARGCSNEQAESRFSP